MTTKSVPQAPAPQALIKPIPDEVARRHPDVTEAQWRTLRDSLFPNAAAASVAMVLDYCKVRRLDPMKKPCHIVPIRVKDPKSGDWAWKDVVMPGIYEHRITAMRSGLYLGHTKPVYGPNVEMFGVTAPEFCEMTMLRRIEGAEDARMEFPVRCYFREAVALSREGKANERWAKAPFQMLTKCTEAAGLREAFPDSLGGEPTFEEMVGQGGSPDTPAAAPIKPAQRLSAKAAKAEAEANRATVQAPVPEPETNNESGGVFSLVTQYGDSAPGKSAYSPSGSVDDPPTETIEATATEVEPEPDPVVEGPIGRIVGVLDKTKDDKFAVQILLDNGFVCVTRDQELAAAAETLRDKKARVELTTRPSRDPKKFAPWLEAIEPMGGAA